MAEKIMTLPNPTAEMVFLYSHIIEQNPRTDRNQALEVLQEWMEGKLEIEETKYSKLRGSPDQCAACIAGCCAFFGCNPVCVAGCVAGICK